MLISMKNDIVILTVSKMTNDYYSKIMNRDIIESNTVELAVNSPRCSLCKELKLDFKQHMIDKHKDIIAYHYLVQMGNYFRKHGLSSFNL